MCLVRVQKKTKIKQDGNLPNIHGPRMNTRAEEVECWKNIGVSQFSPKMNVKNVKVLMWGMQGLKMVRLAVGIQFLGMEGCRTHTLLGM